MTQLNGSTSEVVVTIFEICITIVLGIGGGLIFSWQAAVLSIICSPLLVVGMYKMA